MNTIIILGLITINWIFFYVVMRLAVKNGIRELLIELASDKQYGILDSEQERINAARRAWYMLRNGQ